MNCIRLRVHNIDNQQDATEVETKLNEEIAAGGYQWTLLKVEVLPNTIRNNFLFVFSVGDAR